MKRMQLIAAALCLIMITTVGAGVVAAKQQANPRQAGASSVYLYDVAATDGHGKGKIQINLDKQTYVFNGQGFAPSMMYNLQAKAASGTYVFASAKSTAAGQLHAAGTWDKTAAAQPGSEGFGIVGATVYMGTLQRATSYYPDYTLVYTDYAGQKFAIYLDPKSITPSGLPNEILNPVALDYVYNIDGYHYTVSFVYKGITYTAHWATTTHNPYLTGSAFHCLELINEYYHGDVYLNYWDAAQGKYVKTGANNVEVHVYVYDCDPPCGTGELYEIGDSPTHSNDKGHWSIFEAFREEGHDGYVTFHLAGYPDIQATIKYGAFCTE